MRKADMPDVSGLKADLKDLKALEEQIVELTLRTALCGFFNRFNDALQIGMEDGVVADMLAHGASEDTLPQHAAE